MAKQIINIGSSGNARDGDTLRTAVNKANLNFTELYGGTVSQPLDADLTAIAALTSAADRVLYSTGAQTWSLATFTAAGRALVAGVDAAAQRTTLGLTIGTNVQAYSALLAAIAADSAVSFPNLDIELDAGDLNLLNGNLNIGNGWIAVGGNIDCGGAISGNGTGLTSLNAENLFGTIPLARIVGITNTEIAAGAAIALSKLATDPLARANHTGTQLLATISDTGTITGTGGLVRATSPALVTPALDNATGVTLTLSALLLMAGGSNIKFASGAYIVSNNLVHEWASIQPTLCQLTGSAGGVIWDATNGFKIGSGSAILKSAKYSVDLASSGSILAGGYFSYDVTANGVAAGDTPAASIPVLTQGLHVVDGPFCTTNSIQFTIHNSTGGDLTPSGTAYFRTFEE